MPNQQSSWSIRNFFILQLVSIHTRLRESFLFLRLVTILPKILKKSEKYMKFFQDGFFVFWARG